jgi:two-component system, NtrC family, response regulator AtoC
MEHEPVTEKPTEAVRLLVVSREPSILRALWSVGECNSWHLETAGSGWEALERIQSGTVPDLLLLELPHSDPDSLHILRWLRRLRPELPVILLSQPEHEARKTEALRLGARDFLLQPFDEKRIESSIRRQLASSGDEAQNNIASDEVEQVGDENYFVGASAIMQKMRAQAELLAQANVPVLLVGEPGSGRDTVARLIHKLSLRSSFRFLKVNCAALSDELLEKELFGRKLEICDRGTIFLDEISEIPMTLQEKLLRVMQEKQFSQPGSNRSIDIDVRILAAADTNIERALSQKTLREDLYYRISAFTIHVPPLRQRKEEIPFLLVHLMHKLARHYGLPTREFSPDLLDACQRYSWPGNMSELDSFVKRYLMIGNEDPVTAELADTTHAGNGKLWQMPFVNTNFDSDEKAAPGKSLKSLIKDVKSEAERNAIAAALEKTGWNRKAAARLLKVSYRTMLYKIDQYHLNAAHSYSSPLIGGSAFKGSSAPRWKGAGK